MLFNITKSDAFLVFIFLCALLGLLFGVLDTYGTNKIPEKEVPCYDKYDNIIQGEVCLQKNRLEVTFVGHIMGMFIGLIIALLIILILEFVEIL